MSNLQLDFKNTVDPLARVLLEDSKPPIYTLPTPLGAFTMNKSNAISQSNSQYEFSFNISPQTIVDPFMVVETKYRLSFAITVPNAGQPYGITNNVVPRSWAVAASTTTTQLVLNGKPIGQLNESDCFNQLAKFKDSKGAWEEDITQSEFACQGDFYSGLYDADNEQGNANGAFLQYGSKTYGFNPRVASVSISELTAGEIAANAAGTQYLTMTVRSPVYTGLQGQLLNNSSASGLCGLVNNVRVIRNFTNLGNRLVSLIIPVADPQTTVVVSAQIADNTFPVLYYNTYQIPASLSLPKQLLYPMVDYSYFQQFKSNDIAAGAESQINPNPFVLNVNPRSLYIWASRKQASSSTATLSDAPGFYFTKMQIQIGNNTYFSSSTSSLQLFNEFCAKEGFEYSYQECIGVQNTSAALASLPTHGMVLRIAGEKLISNPNATIGTLNGNNCTITCSIMAVDPLYAGTVYLNILVVDDAVMVINSELGSCDVIKGLITEADVAKIRMDKPISVKASYETGGKLIQVKPEHELREYHRKVKEEKKSKRGGNIYHEMLDDEEEFYGGKVITKDSLRKRLAELLNH